MELAISVGFWDAGPEAIGEDMHMYLKCLFATRGHVIVKSIFSPASQCNIEGEGSGYRGYLSGVHARYIQAKRHLWGSLDTGYSLRKALLSYIDPHSQATVKLKNMHVNKLDKLKENVRMPLYTLFSLFHRLLEAHVLMGQLFIMIIVGSLIFPISSSISYDWSAYLWSLISGQALSEEVIYAVELCLYIRLFSLIPNVLMISLYEKYLQWVGFERWALQEQMLAQEKNRFMYPKSDGYLGELKQSYKAAFTASESNSHLVVQHLGKRASLASPRTYPFALLDWVVIPVSGLLYYVIPQCVAQITHLWTNRLVYKVIQSSFF